MQETIKDPDRGITYRKWCSEPCNDVFVLVHGLGAHSGRWDFFANYFLQKKASSYALELKGFGLTTSLKGHIDSFNTYYDDISSLYLIAKQENPNSQIFLLAESMGALISFVYCVKNLQSMAGLILISPAFESCLPIKFVDQLKMFFAAIFNPKKSFFMPFTSSMCTQDQEYVKEMDASDAEHRIASAYLLLQTVFTQIYSKIFAGKINVPSLFLLAGKDKFVNPLASQKIFNKIKIQDKKLIKYPEMYHALSIERDRNIVFRDIGAWVTMISNQT